MTSNEAANAAVRDACTTHHATSCDPLVTNSDFDRIGVRFQSGDHALGIFHGDSDLFWFGPERAKGVIVWIPGRSAELGRRVQITRVKSPNYLREFNNRGWDVVHYYAPPVPKDNPSPDNEVAVFKEFDEAVGNLRQLGYRRVLLAGHSWGASFAFYQASILKSLDGLIATSPGAARIDPPTQEDTDRGLRLLIASAKSLDHATRVAVVLTNGDEFNPFPAVRSTLLLNALLSAAVPSLILRPAGNEMKGHFGAEQFDFAVKFSRCLADFFERPTVELHETCAQ